MKTFKDIDPQKIVDNLCEQYRILDKHLGLPKHGLPASYQKYWFQENSIQKWLFTKYFRNIAALDRLEACIERLDQFWIGVEYFNENIVIQRKIGKEFNKDFMDSFFFAIIVDSIRSSLDIFAKSLGWYFDLSEKHEMGFSYGSLIKPLKKISSGISDACNDLYKSDEYVRIKEFRDAEKHTGFGKNKIEINRMGEALKLMVQRPENINIQSLEIIIVKLLDRFLSLVTYAVTELQGWDLGYDSPNDQNAYADENGLLHMEL